MTESRNDGITDRLKTVYPPKTSFCGGYFAGGIMKEKSLQDLHYIKQFLFADMYMNCGYNLKVINTYSNVLHWDNLGCVSKYMYLYNYHPSKQPRLMFICVDGFT